MPVEMKFQFWIGGVEVKGVENVRIEAKPKLPAWLQRIIRLTKREYFADFFITPPITAALAVWSIAHGFGLAWLALFAAGWFVWTAYEYAVHLASHHLPILVDLHRLHHRNQKEYIGLHPLLTLAIYAAVWATFGMSAAPFAIGFSAGYIAYAAMHTAFHYAQILPGHPLYAAKQRHVAHHRYHNRNFGVTWGLWDFLLGTD